MRPGEYTGAGGDSRRWMRMISGTWAHYRELQDTGEMSNTGIRTADLHAAARALVALADETDCVWIAGDLRLRVSDVITIQRLVGGEWERVKHDSAAQTIIAAFRAGQKHGDSERAS